MTIREKLADWISGGALSEERRRYSLLSDAATDEIGRLKRGLNEIKDMETPKAAPTVKKAASVAKRVLNPTAQWYTGYDRLNLYPWELT